jgi:ribokinase
VTSGEATALQSPSVVVVGSLNLDIVVPVPHHPSPGETVLGGVSFRNPGGKGANQAVAVARLGRPVAMVGSVGDDDAGRALVTSLEREGVDVTNVLKRSEVPSGLALIAVDGKGENSIVVSPGANNSLTTTDVRSVAAQLGSADVVLLQLEIPMEAVAEAATLTRGNVVLNPAPAEQVPAAVLERVDILVPNRAELAILSGADRVESIRDVVAAARGLRGPRAVVATLGSDGAVVIQDDRWTHVEAPSVKVVDTTAAGDCFCGALAVALVDDRALEDAARWATAAAAIATTRPGAQTSMPYRSDLEGATR